MILRLFCCYYFSLLAVGSFLIVTIVSPEGIIERLSPNSAVVKIPQAVQIIEQVILRVPNYKDIYLIDKSGVIRPNDEKEFLYLLTQTFPTDWADDTKQIACMAYNAYFEAAGEGENGQKRVMQVVMNRAKNRGLSPCGVVYERNRNTCEFSWVCDGLPDTIRDRRIFGRIQIMAREFLNGEYFDDSYGADYYFNPSTATSSWHLTLFKKGYCARAEGNHIFFNKKLEGQQTC